MKLKIRNRRLKVEQMIFWISNYLIIVLAYGFVSKVLDIHSYFDVVKQQPFPHWMIEGLSILLPVAEFYAAVTLCDESKRSNSLLLALIIMGGYFLYAQFILSAHSSNLPSLIMGIFKDMPWELQADIYNASATFAAVAICLDEFLVRFIETDQKIPKKEAVVQKDIESV